MPELKHTKEEIVKKAEEFGAGYEAKYKGCCQCTFLAVVDALNWGGLEIVPQDAVNRFYPGICFLTAGTNLTGEGTCGAVCASALAIGIALGKPMGSGEETDQGYICGVITENILDRYYQKYGSILCKDVMRKHFGKAWDLTRPDMTQEFLSITDGCTIMETAGWITECILSELEKGNG